MDIRSKSAYQKKKANKDLIINTQFKQLLYGQNNNKIDNSVEKHYATTKIDNKFDHLSKKQHFILRQAEQFSRSAIQQLQELYTPSHIQGKFNWQINKDITNNYINPRGKYDYTDKIKGPNDNNVQKVGQMSLSAKIQLQQQNNRKLTLLYETQRIKYKQQKQKNKQLTILLKKLQQINKKAEQQSKNITQKNSQQYDKINQLQSQLKKQLITNLQLEECMVKCLERKKNDKEKIQKLETKIKAIENKYLENITHMKSDFQGKKRIGQMQIQKLLREIEVKDREFEKLKEFAYSNRSYEFNPVKINEKKSGFFNRFVQFSKELDMKCDINGFSTLNSMIGTAILNTEDHLHNKRSHSLNYYSPKEANIQATLNISQLNKKKATVG